MSRKKPSPVIKPKAGQNSTEEKCISVSFRFLSKNKARNFEFFGDKNRRQKSNALEQLFEFLQRLTSKTKLESSRLARDRDCGFECIKAENVNCTPHGYVLRADSSIFVFRFGDNGNGGDYRLLGFFEEETSVLYVIGFDFDYSAYRHD